MDKRFRPEVGTKEVEVMENEWFWVWVKLFQENGQRRQGQCPRWKGEAVWEFGFAVWEGDF